MVVQMIMEVSRLYIRGRRTGIGEVGGNCGFGSAAAGNGEQHRMWRDSR